MATLAAELPADEAAEAYDLIDQLAQMAKLVRPEDFTGRMVISADPDEHRKAIQRFVDLGFDRVYLHNVGRNQAEWLEVFGRDVLPKLTR